MRVKDVMTEHAQYISPDASLHEVAMKMRDLNCGFLPVSDESGDRLIGVITDRDIAVRAVAEGKDPNITIVREVMSSGVYYCFADDDLASAAHSMREQRVYRLVVLDNADSKQLCGIITLGDIYRHGQEALGGSTASGIAGQAA